MAGERVLVGEATRSACAGMGPGGQGNTPPLGKWDECVRLDYTTIIRIPPPEPSGGHNDQRPVASPGNPQKQGADRCGVVQSVEPDGAGSSPATTTRNRMGIGRFREGRDMGATRLDKRAI